MEKYYTGIKNLSLPTIYTTIHYYNLLFPTELIKKNIINYLKIKKKVIIYMFQKYLEDVEKKELNLVRKK